MEINGLIITEILEVVLVEFKKNVSIESIDIKVSCYHDQIVLVMFLVGNSLFDDIMKIFELYDFGVDTLLGLF